MKRGRKPRLSGMTMEEWYNAAAPAFRVAELLATLPACRGREKYNRAISLAAKEYRLSRRTLERRMKDYRPLVESQIAFQETIAWFTAAMQERYWNLVRQKAAAGEFRWTDRAMPVPKAWRR